MQLKDRVALVTGAGAGNGRAIALRFAAEGASVAVADIDLSGAEETVAMLTGQGGRALAVRADVSRSADVAACVETVTAHLGPVDILVNNAGIHRSVPLVEMTEEEFDLVMAVNVKSIFLLSQLVVRQMLARKAKGKIINLGSIMSVVGTSRGGSAYAASKGAVLQFTRCMALELAADGINVNAIGPGQIETAMTQKFRDAPVLMESVLKMVPMGRIGQPRDVAEVALFLASPASDYVTGSFMVVDGGYTAW